MLNEKMTSCETNRLNIFFFKKVMNGLATLSLKEVTLSVVILMSVAASKSSFVSSNSNTQFTAGNMASSSVLSVASTRGEIAVTSIFTAWRDLLNLQLVLEHNQEDIWQILLRVYKELC